MNLSFDVLRHAPIALALFASLVSPACGLPDEEEPAMTSTTTPGTTPTVAPPASTPSATPTTPPSVAPPPEPAPEPAVEPTQEPTTDPNTPPARCASGTGPSYSTISAIMDAKCTPSCHEPNGLGGPPAGFYEEALDLTSAAGYSQLTTMKSVQVPEMSLVGSELEDSYLWYKLHNMQADVGGTGLSMPLGSELPANELALVEAWITGGACP